MKYKKESFGSGNIFWWHMELRVESDFIGDFVQGLRDFTKNFLILDPCGLKFSKVFCRKTWNLSIVWQNPHTSPFTIRRKRMTIIIKALSFPKCEGFIRLNLNVFSFFFGCFLCSLSFAFCFISVALEKIFGIRRRREGGDEKAIFELRCNEFKSVYNTARIK